MDQAFEQLEGVRPDLLFGLVVGRAQVVHKAAVPERGQPRLPEKGVEGDMGQFFIRLVSAFELNDIAVLMGLAQGSLDLLAGLDSPGKLLSNMAQRRKEVRGELVILRTLHIKSDYPPRVLEQLRVVLSIHLSCLVAPLLGFELGVFVELQDHQSRVHGFVVVIQELVLARFYELLEQTHAEDVDRVRILEGVQVYFPEASRTRVCVLQHLLDVVFQLVRHHYYKDEARDQ